MPKKLESNRDLILAALADRESMTVEEWTWSLQEKVLADMRAGDPGAYIDLLETVAFRKEPPSKGIAPPPRKTCDTCRQEKYANQFPAGTKTCMSCVIDRGRENSDRQIAKRNGRKAAV